MTLLTAFTWLVHSVLASTILLMLGALAVLAFRQPADRVRLIQFLFVGILGLLALLAVPGFKAISLGIFHSEEVTNLEVVSPLVGRHPEVGDRAANGALLDLSQEQTETSEGLQRMPEANQPSGAFTLPETQAPSAWNRDWAKVAMLGTCGAYVLGAFVFLTMWVRARLGLAYLVRAAGDVPGRVRAELVRIAGDRAEGVRLLASEAIVGPITWGTRRPTIVIPKASLGEDQELRLRYYLAHEWAHIASRDFITWQVATLLQFFLFYQPLFWWLRRRLAVCMDQLADAKASEQGNSAIDYADFLLQHARQRVLRESQLALGIVDRRSSLRQRVVFLLQGVAGLRSTCSTPRSMTVGAATILVVISLSVVRLDAQPTSDSAALQENSETSSATESSIVSESDDGTLTYSCIVTDGDTEAPIPGAKVKVYHKNSRDWNTLEVTEHVTDAAGRYRLIIPPEQAALGSLYLEVEADHPNYCPRDRRGYSHAMIRKNLKLGEIPFFAHIRLWPGEAVTGMVVSPEGEPLADVEVSMYSKSDQIQELFEGSWGKTRTNADGTFRIVPATPGDGVLWIKPEEYSPQAHRLAERRGDWGQITVAKGTDVTGRVLDVDGDPVGGVKVEARSRDEGDAVDEFLRENAVGGQIGRRTVTDSNGNFTLASLPAGDYVLSIEPDSEGYDPPPLDQVFLRQEISVVDGRVFEPLEIRAVPHVVIKGRYFDSSGKPRSGHQVALAGEFNSKFFYVQSNDPGKDGLFEVRGPRGLTDARINLITNEHSALRWRLRPDKELEASHYVDLGTLESDIDGFEVFRYVAPILLVRAIDEEGTPIKDFKPVLTYGNREVEGEPFTLWTTGHSVHFEDQQDGRWRSSQLLPDELFRITLEKDGYSTTPQELSLPEGGEKELTFVLKTDPSEDASLDKETPGGG